MLDKLVESKDKRQDNKTVRRLLMATSTVTVSGVAFALMFSLFNQTLAMGNESIALSTLVAPLPVTDYEPPMEPKKPKTSKPTKITKSAVPTRRQNILRIDETPTKAPTKTSTTPSNAKARPRGAFEISLRDSPDVEFSSISNDKNTRTVSEFRFSESETPKKVKRTPKKIAKNAPKLPPPPKKVVKKPKKDVVVSIGVINGKAINLVKPPFPAPAISIGLKGKVTVQVMISKNGKVLSAKVLSGHPLFRRNALSAAKRSTFSPTYLSKQKVKVRGIIVYNFK